MPDRDLDLIVDAAHAAGKIALEAFGSQLKSWDKGGNAGPVTEADLAIDKMLSETLLAARPDYGWLSEETEDAPDRLGHKRVFVVDPIDGTRSFIEGARDWGHSIAVVEDDQVIAGAVYMPKHDTLYTATLGGGAFRDGEPIKVGDCACCSDATVLCSKANMAESYWSSGTPPPFTRTFRSSLAYRLCLVARGRFDGMLTLRPTWEWDVAAGTLIVTEAGGCVRDAAGQPPRFNQPHAQIPGLIAGPAGLCGEIIRDLAQSHIT